MKTNLTRLRGRAKRGHRLTMDAPFGNWGTQTLVAGLTQDALIAPWVITRLKRNLSDNTPHRKILSGGRIFSASALAFRPIKAQSVERIRLMFEAWNRCDGNNGVMRGE